jgi:hypothetical protein
LRRVQSEERIGKKLTDPAALQRYFETDTLQYPDVPETLVLDATGLDPDEAATVIQQSLLRNGSGYLPATSRHLRLR